MLCLNYRIKDLSLFKNVHLFKPLKYRSHLTSNIYNQLYITFVLYITQATTLPSNAYGLNSKVPGWWNLQTWNKSSICGISHQDSYQINWRQTPFQLVWFCCTGGAGLFKIRFLLEAGVTLPISRHQLRLLAKQKAHSPCSLLLPHSFSAWEGWAKQLPPAPEKKQWWAVVFQETPNLKSSLHRIKSASVAICVIFEFPGTVQIYRDT